MSKPKTISRRDFLAGISATSVTLAACCLPRPVLAGGFKPEKAPPNARIARVAVYPPIGMSRVGSAALDKAFRAPEVPGTPTPPPGGYKDGQRQMKKQVQRFFLYAFDDRGRVIGELTGKNANIEWTVHVANTKAAWYGFNNPLNLGKDAPGIPAAPRNEGIQDPREREQRLIIDPGPVSIAGKKNLNANGGDRRYQLADWFWNKDIRVKLGELRTDEDGRLEVIPADGVSASAIPDNPIKDFTKNDAWYDDWCDGWVKARVEVNGSTYDALPGWVACCGPNYAPEIPPFSSMFDTVADVLVERFPHLRPPKLSFSRDIYPIFYRLGLMEWVSGASLQREGWIEVGNFADPAYIARLADLRNTAEREKVFAAFRDPSARTEQQYRLPYMLGSGVDYDGSPAHWFLMPKLQYWILRQWRKGNYVNDFAEFLTEQRQREQSGAQQTIHSLPTHEQPFALTKAALEPLSGGNFHPGVELTWVLGQIQLFDDRDPFRIKLGDRCSLLQNVGRLITPENAFPPPGVDLDKPVPCLVFGEGNVGKSGRSTENLADRYPVGPQMPGDLTRWMGLPWQPDAFSCQNVTYANDFPTVVWWPALLPVDVMPEYAYRQLLRTDLAREQRLQFAATRVPWARGAAGIGYHANASYFDGLNRMVYLWERMGMIEKRPAPVELTKGPKPLPKYLYVEVERGSMDLEFDQRPYDGLPGEAPCSEPIDGSPRADAKETAECEADRG